MLKYPNFSNTTKVSALRQI